MKQEYIEENPNCEETYATFRIIGDKLNPGDITTKLNMEPSFSYAKGEKFQSHCRMLKRPIGIWAITSENRVHSTSLERHLWYLLEYLESASLQIQEFVDNPDFEVDFLCYWLSATGHGGPVLSCHILERVAALCNTLNFDYYGPYVDKEESNDC